MKGQMLYDFTHMKYLKQSKPQKQSRKVIAMGWRQDRGELMFNGYRVSVLQDEKILDLLHNSEYT